MDTLEPTNFGVILPLYTGLFLSEMKLYWHGSVGSGTTELGLIVSITFVLAYLISFIFPQDHVVLLLIYTIHYLPNNNSLH